MIRRTGSAESPKSASLFLLSEALAVALEQIQQLSGLFSIVQISCAVLADQRL